MPTSRPEELIEKLEAGGEKVWPLRALAGLEGGPKTPLQRLAGYLRTDPAKAVASASLVSSAEFFKLGPTPWALVYGEAVRTGAGPAAEAMRKVPYLSPSEAALFEALVRGEKAELAKDGLDDAIYAAGCVIRARNPQLSEKERQTLLTDARARAPLLLTHPDAVSAWLP
ncbi:MAG: hypothetical protein M3Y59_16840 [Myxococcota bacterium]|nr:hypothetical protein [Myxococcota bacterium]